MNGLKILLAGVALTVASATYAMDYPWLTFRLTDNEELSVAAENLALYYVDGNLQLKSATVDHTLPVTQIRAMQFTTESAGVEDIFESLSEEGEYFTLSGQSVGKFSTLDEAHRSLPSGVYVRKGKSKSLKIIF